MTVSEAGENYNIPAEILNEYESWGLCSKVKKVMGVCQYDDTDLEHLSIIMTLHDIGFSSEEVKSYMQLLMNGRSTENERLRMLDKLRSNVLDEIHFKEKQLERMDYLRHKIRNGK